MFEIKLIIFASLISSFFIILSTHPIVIVIIISFQSLLVSITLAYFSQNSWFSLILFLVFIGGLIVLFIYISSLASNEIFTQTRKIRFILIPIYIATITVFILNAETQSNNSIRLSIKERVIKIYRINNFYITLFIILYLLLVLIISVSIINLYEGPLRRITA